MVKNNIVGFTVAGASMPANALCDKMATILAKEIVRCIPWENAPPETKR